MKQKWIDAFMDTAERFAQLSSARRLKVGAVVVKDHRIISIGYNGTPHGWDNNCEDEFGLDLKGLPTLVTRPEVIHAEMNSLMKLAKSTESGNDASMFLTHAPCIHCAKAIYGAGITTVYYKNEYRDNEGALFLRKCGIKIQKL